MLQSGFHSKVSHGGLIWIALNLTFTVGTAGLRDTQKGGVWRLTRWLPPVVLAMEVVHQERKSQNE